MFVKLLHGLHAVVGAISKYLQHWTNVDVPDNTRTLHNFKDGQGKVPAVPYDETTISNVIESVKTDDTYVYNKDDVTQSNNILRVKLRTELASGNDNLTNKTGIESIQCIPEPVVFEIQNEVPDKIEKIVPVKTQALPGQDYIFEIVYVKDYNYIEGDILPVFDDDSKVKFSKDGRILTVNSNANLAVRLILSPAPQDWIPEKPDSSLERDGYKTLDIIPRDGSRSLYSIENTLLENYFNIVKIENKATNFVTNNEFANNKNYTLTLDKSELAIPMTFANGYNHTSIYWKCYEDPKASIPVTGSYPITDYNEDIGPLPDEYRKLQYIYTNNGAYFDLGIKLKKDYKVKILANISNTNSNSTHGLFGARNSTSTDWGNDNKTDGAYACYTRYNGYETIGYQRGTKRYYSSSSTTNIYNDLKWFYSTGKTFEVQNYNGSVIRRYTSDDTQNVDTEWNCYLFTVNDMGNPYAYKATGYLYRCEIWDENDQIIMQLIPAKLNNTDIFGLYDVINDKFYKNQNPVATLSGQPFYVYQKNIQCSDKDAIIYLEQLTETNYKLHIENITKDIDIGIIRNPMYDDPFKLEKIDSNKNIIHTYDFLNSSLTNYFNVISLINNATDYATFDSTYKVANSNGIGTFTVTYKPGYESYDLKATADLNATITFKPTFYISNDSLLIPNTYTPVIGLHNSNLSTYIKTGYIPKSTDKIVCYGMLTEQNTYPTYFFGTRDGSDGYKSLSFIAAWGSYYQRSYLGYDRCRSVMSYDSNKNLLFKLTANKTNCIVDYNYGSTTINTSTTPVDCVYEMYLFNCNSRNSKLNSANGDIYKFTVYDEDDSIIRNYIPVRRIEDGVLGFFETVEQKFYTPTEGEVSESSEPIYKSTMTISNVTEDTKVTISKNADARKNFYLEEGYENDYEQKKIDELIFTRDFVEASLDYWFYTAKYINNAYNICAVTCYGPNNCNIVVKPNTTTVFPVKYNPGLNETFITANATNGALTELTSPLFVPESLVPHEYTKIDGIENTDTTNIGFLIDYIVKANDTIKIWMNHPDTYWNYYDSSSYVILGSYYNGKQLVLYNRNYGSGQGMYYSRNNINYAFNINKEEVYCIELKANELILDNGYSPSNKTFTNTPADCEYKLAIFGANNLSCAAFTGTIYRITIFDDNNNITCDLKPVIRKLDNVIGFYDSVADTFNAPYNNHPGIKIAMPPKVKGKLIVTNITEDCDITINEAPLNTPVEYSGEISHLYSYLHSELLNLFYVVEISNLASNYVTFNGYTYSNCCVVYSGGTMNLTATYVTGYSANNFILSEGTLTNNGITLTNVTSDKKIVLMLNDYHDASCDTNDDLGIFTNPDFSDYCQYRIIAGDDTLLSSFTFINSQIAEMSNRTIYEFDNNEIDLINFNPSNTPGNIKTKAITSDSNMMETVENITIGSNTLYKHHIILRNQVMLESGKCYIFKVRDNYDTGKLIAYAKSTENMNLVNSNNEIIEDETGVYFKWDEANKYIVKGNKNIYFEINNIKI